MEEEEEEEEVEEEVEEEEEEYKNKLEVCLKGLISEGYEGKTSKGKREIT